MKKLITSAAVAAVLFAASPAKADSLSAAELRGLFPGSYVAQVMGKWSLNIRLAPGGALSGKTALGSDTGRWSIEGSRLCVSWNKWTDGRKECSVLTRNGRRVSGRGFSFNV